MHPVSATKYSTIHNDTSKHHVFQNTCHATHPYTPAPQNVACPARTRRAIQNHTPARKMQPALQPNQASQSKIITAPRAHARQPWKWRACHDKTPRYHPKWPPHYTTRTHTHAKLQNAACTTTKHHVTIQNSHRATRTRTPSFKNAARTTTRHHVTIENSHRTTGKPSIITWCSRFKKSINILLFREHHVTIEHRATTRAQFCTITCSKCCACHEKTT